MLLWFLFLFSDTFMGRFSQQLDIKFLSDCFKQSILKHAISSCVKTVKWMRNMFDWRRPCFSIWIQQGTKGLPIPCSSLWMFCHLLWSLAPHERESQFTYNIIYYTAYIRICYYQNQRMGEKENEREGQRRKLTLFASFVAQSSEEKFIFFI